MMVPRAYRFTSTPPMEKDFDEKSGRRKVLKSVSPKPAQKVTRGPTTPARTTTESMQRQAEPMAIPTYDRSHSAGAEIMPPLSSSAPNGSKKTTKAHDPNALPPAVAALLAMTEIPRPKQNQFRRRSTTPQRISIDELVQGWRNDDSLKGSYGTSPALSILLEDIDGREEPSPTPDDNLTEERFAYMRTTSAESVPSLEADDRSVASSGSPSTPQSLRSRKSIPNLRKEKTPRSLPTAEECASSHPLIPPLPVEEDADITLILSSQNKSQVLKTKPKVSFKSNLTSSLQALKNAAISSISSFSIGSGNTATPSRNALASPMSDDILWSHPFLFPRLTPEIRPAVTGTPTQAQRRYLNPMPLTFEEQEAPYQLALHAPYLAQATHVAPKIQMQTYSRAKRKGPFRRMGPDPQSEAGRALLGVADVRQREVRENGDFLRVVVMEMNMKRAGKLEAGKAKIWLPPRKAQPTLEEGAKVPRRWVGVSAY